MGQLVGRSTRTIQAVELGQLPLSEDLGQEICRQTGVSLEWLMKNDVDAPPVGELGLPYDKGDFERTQAWLNTKFGEGEFDAKSAKDFAHGLMGKLSAIGSSAVKQGKWDLFLYKGWRALEALKKDFGEDDGAPEHIRDGDERETAKLLKQLWSALDAVGSKSRRRAR